MAREAEDVTLVVRSPTARESDFQMRVPLGSTVRSIKSKLCEEHPDHPPPEEQRLIFAGQLLKDEANTNDVLRQVLTLPATPPASPPPPPWQQSLSWGDCGSAT